MRTTPDPILAAITRHQAAYEAFQVAPEGEDSELADDDMMEARSGLLSTSCSTLAGCFALVEHLRWFIDEEAVNYAAEDGHSWRQIKAREAELTMLLGSKMPTHRPAIAYPDGSMTVSGLTRWHAKRDGDPTKVEQVERICAREDPRQTSLLPSPASA